MSHFKNTPKDFFSGGNGGELYENFRPKYPREFIDSLNEFGKDNSNYLDIACGTGQILLDIIPSFNNLCVGVDISETQLKVASEKVSELLKKKQEVKARIELIKSNAFQVAEELKNKNLSCKFDLITIGEALHWFDTDELFKYVKLNLLEKEGRFCILSYTSPSIEYNVDDTEFKFKPQYHFDNFFSTIKSSFNYNLDSFFSGYEDVCFADHFKSVKKSSIISKDPLSVEAYIGYYSTYSGYATYLKNHAHDDLFVDPMLTLKQALENDLKEYALKKNIIIPNQALVITNHHYYTELSD